MAGEVVGKSIASIRIRSYDPAAARFSREKACGGYAREQAMQIAAGDGRRRDGARGAVFQPQRAHGVAGRGIRHVFRKDGTGDVPPNFHQGPLAI